MKSRFHSWENLYRAVYPPEIMPMFWKENGKISSAAFKDKNGLSVERAGGRTEEVIINNMRLFFYGTIISVLVGDCEECKAVVKYLPTRRSLYHSEIHGSNESKRLTQSQCKFLADRARICNY